MDTQLNILSRVTCEKCDQPYMILEPGPVTDDLMALLEEGAGLQALQVVILGNEIHPKCSNCAAVLDVPSKERMAEWYKAIRAFGHKLIARAERGESLE